MLRVHVAHKDDSKKEKLKAKVHNKIVDFQCWWDENKQDVIALTPVAVGGLVAGFKFGNKLLKSHQEKYMREHAIWDPKQMHWWILKKKPTSWQWSEIDRRKNAGEPVADILRSLGMLK